MAASTTTSTPATDATPDYNEMRERNALQVLFLDDDFCRAVVGAAYPDLIKKSVEPFSKGKSHAPTSEINVAVEFGDYISDALITVSVIIEGVDKPISLIDDAGKRRDRFAVVMQPMVVEDYSSVIRRMLGIDVYTRKILFVGTYTGTGATEAQFVDTCDRSGIKVVFRRDIADKAAKAVKP